MTPDPAAGGKSGPLVSVILPVYNGEKYLAETLESLLRQTYPALEVIAVDDGSGDRSPAILDDYLEKFGGRLAILHIPNSGVSRARNTGVERARGFYIAFIDQDDLWAPDKVVRQVEALSRSHARISFTNAAVIDREGRVRASRMRRFPRRDTVNWFEQILFDPVVPISSVMMEKALFLEAGGFSPDLRISEDYDLLLRILWRQKPEVLDEPLLSYRDHPGSHTYARTDAILREGMMVMGRWRARHPEIIRRNRVKYAFFRIRLEFLRVKAVLQRGIRRDFP
jgi:glycosyltransferase involved in cell wall biosynthesis